MAAGLSICCWPPAPTAAPWAPTLTTSSTPAPTAAPGQPATCWRSGDFIQGRGAPCLDLPATGWDTYSVTGWGYIQGRFRGLILLYAETEYRFNLTRSPVLGVVVFANVQTARAPATGFGRPGWRGRPAPGQAVTHVPERILRRGRAGLAGRVL